MKNKKKRIDNAITTVCHSNNKFLSKYDFNKEDIYHYTSPDGLNKILIGNNQILMKFTRYEFLSDYNEGRHIIKCIEKYLLKRLEEGKISKRFFKELVNLDPINLMTTNLLFSELKENCLIDSSNFWSLHKPCNTYLCCFSESSDSLSMWNYYSKNSKQEGYSLNLNSKAITLNDNDEYSLELKKVIYDDEKKFEILDSIYLPLNAIYDDAWAINTESKGKIVIDIVSCICYFINNFKYIFKDKAFEDEHEVRAILRVSTECKRFEEKFAIKNGAFVPYVLLSFENALKQITTAPMLKDEIARMGLSLYLKKNNYEDVKIVSSEIPVRF